MCKIKVMLIVVFSFIISIQLNAQNIEIKNVEWVDSMRTFLTIDSTYCLDSIISFKAQNRTFNISISKKRPNLEKALLLLDSVYLLLDDDLTNARLRTLLYEFDTKYRSEFVYTIDYYQSAYHKDVRVKTLDEYKFIGQIEGAFQAHSLLRDSSLSIIELLGYKDINYWIETHAPISSTWEKFGSVDLSFLKRIYDNNYKFFDEELKFFLTREIPVNKYYSVCYVFKLFDRTDPSKIDCERIKSLIDEKTSKNFITALKNINTKFHEFSCLNDLLKNY